MTNMGISLNMKQQHPQQQTSTQPVLITGNGSQEATMIIACCQRLSSSMAPTVCSLSGRRGGTGTYYNEAPSRPSSMYVRTAPISHQSQRPSIITNLTSQPITRPSIAVTLPWVPKPHIFAWGSYFWGSPAPPSPPPSPSPPPLLLPSSSSPPSLPQIVNITRSSSCGHSHHTHYRHSHSQHHTLILLHSLTPHTLTPHTSRRPLQTLLNALSRLLCGRPRALGGVHPLEPSINATKRTLQAALWEAARACGNATITHSPGCSVGGRERLGARTLWNTFYVDTLSPAEILDPAS